MAVIGGGTAGIVAAKTAAAFGAKVVLIERDRTGGDCLWTGYIIVDKHLRTSNPRIWAAGDLTGHPQFTHTAGAHGSIAATNAILGVRRSVGATVAPRVTFTDPEIAAVGIDPQSAQRIPGLRVVELSHHDLDRAITEADIHGLTQLVLDRGHRIVGAGVVGPRAGETIGEMVLAVNQGLRTRDLAGATHPYPTYNDGPWNASIADVRSQLQGRAVSRLIATIVRLRRRWLRFRADPG
ncbi:MAG: FAD-dependent oxidoreductase [Actinomycetia bacterium]|nr:FAD-dependent oxidoreductase [Actinomycetes bacterium]MCH9762346.1 FAD-dependent oxidoreductase [Actinomycetes bacterium]